MRALLCSSPQLAAFYFWVLPKYFVECSGFLWDETGNTNLEVTVLHRRDSGTDSSC